MEPVIFQIVPVSTKMYWLWLAIAVPVVLVVVLAAYIPYMAKNTDEGYVHVPQGPGLGWDINFDYIRSHMVKGG